MCGEVSINNQSVHFACDYVPIDHWRTWWPDPEPPIDITRIEVQKQGGDCGPDLDRSKVELTAIGQMLSIAGHLRDVGHANQLAAAVVNVGNDIAQQAGLNVSFAWTDHNQAN